MHKERKITLDLNTYIRLRDFTQTFYVFDKEDGIKVGDHLTFSRHTDPLLQRKVTYLEPIGDNKVVVSLTRALQSRSTVPFTQKSGTGSFTKHS